MVSLGFGWNYNFQLPQNSYSNGFTGSYSQNSGSYLTGQGNPLDALTSALSVINGGNYGNPYGLDFGNQGYNSPLQYQPQVPFGSPFSMPGNQAAPYQMQNDPLAANKMLGAHLENIGRDLQDDGIINNSHLQQQQQQQQMNPMQQMMQMMMQMMMQIMMMIMQMLGMNPQQAQQMHQQLQQMMSSMPGMQNMNLPAPPQYANNGGAHATASAGPNGASASASAGNSHAAASSNANAPAYQPQGSTAKGRQIAANAERTARELGTTGWCAKGVRIALERSGIHGVGAASAYQVADKLARNSNFQEVNVQRNDLKNLPAGAVVVWDRCPGHKHGHISIALGDGREASDHIQQQMTNYGPRYRVFLPK